MNSQHISLGKCIFDVIFGIQKRKKLRSLIQFLICHLIFPISDFEKSRGKCLFLERYVENSTLVLKMIYFIWLFQNVFGNLKSFFQYIFRVKPFFQKSCPLVSYLMEVHRVFSRKLFIYVKSFSQELS